MSKEIVQNRPGDRCLDIWVASQLIEWAAGKEANGETKAALRRDIKDMADQIAGPSPSPVERLLAETAALDWFALRFHEAQHAGNASSESGQTIAQSDHNQRRIDRAHRRLMSTLRTLATVRRLAVPAVQINVARQQVNVAGAQT